MPFSLQISRFPLPTEIHPAQNARLVVSLLGTPQIIVDGEPVGDLQNQKTLALLAYLMIESDRAHSRVYLAALLWPEQIEKRANQNLRQTLSRLRRAIRDQESHTHHILITTQTLQFNTESDYWLDVAAFRELIAITERHRHRRLAACNPCIAQLTAALSFYRGRLLTGIRVFDSMAFDEWLLIESERLRQSATRVMRTLAGICLSRNEVREAGEYAHHMLNLDPLDETALRFYLRVLTLENGRNAALMRYQKFREELNQTLDIEPEDETQALIKQIHLGELDKPAAKFSNAQLPTSTTTFVGREAERTKIAALLSDQDHRLVTILGPGGIGKTRLALQVATEQAHVWHDGVWFISMDSLPPKTRPDSLAVHIGQILGVAIDKQVNPREALSQYLEARESLLVVDNFEHLLESAGFLIDILNTALKVKILVTSRERLDCQAEFLVDLRGLEYPAGDVKMDDSRVGDYSAVQLFRERAERVGFSTVERDLPDVINICRLVEGYPLALELAAVWTRDQNPAQIAHQIENDLDFLTASFRDIPDRHRSLGAVFAHSWRLLTRVQQAVYRQLAVFKGGFSLESAEAVISVQSPVINGRSSVSSGQYSVNTEHCPLITDHINALVAKSLLRQDSPDRYTFHPLVDQYAAEELAKAVQEEHKIRNRHGRYYLAFLQDRVNLLSDALAKEVASEINLELANLRAAWEWAVAQSWVSAVEQSIIGMSRFFQVMGLLQEGEVVFERAAKYLLRKGAGEEGSVGDAETKFVVGRLFVEQARFLFHLGQYADTIECAQAAIEQARASQDQLSEAVGKYFWGEALRCQGEFAPARVQLEQAFSLARAATHPSPDMQRVKLDSLGALAGVCVWQSDYDGAKVYLEQALRLVTDSGDQRGLGQVLGYLGVVASEQGDYVRARDNLLRSLHIRQTLGDQIGESMTLGNLANVYLNLGAYADAKTHYEKALRIQREVGARQSETLTVGNLSLLFYYLGDYETANDYSQQALQMAQEIGDRRAQGAMWMKKGHALTGLGRLDEAAEAYQESVAVRRELGQLQPMTEPLAGLAHIAMSQQKLEQAQTYVDEILAIAKYHPDLGGVIDPMQIYLTCYQVLNANDDSQADEVLDNAYLRLQERADKITDDGLKQSFLNNVAAHQALVDAWVEKQS